MGGKTGRTLDVGAALPVLASELAALGCKAHALEGQPVAHDLPRVISVVGDFEADDLAIDKYRLLTFIHNFEHLYDPLAAICKMRALVADDGAVFIRMPDNQVAGIER
ncbi:MAG: methyltransferase domain-containing protein, partial [Terriglobia bacterium]